MCVKTQEQESGPKILSHWGDRRVLKTWSRVAISHAHFCARHRNTARLHFLASLRFWMCASWFTPALPDFSEEHTQITLEAWGRSRRPASECVSLVRYQANLLIRRVVSWPANSHRNTFQCRSIDSSLRPGIERVAPSTLTQWLRPMTNARQRGARARKKKIHGKRDCGGRRRVCIGVGCLWRTHYVMMMRPFHLSSCRRVHLTNLENNKKCNTTLAKIPENSHL